MSEPPPNNSGGIDFGPYLWVLVLVVIVAFFWGLYRDQQWKIKQEKKARYYARINDEFD